MSLLKGETGEWEIVLEAARGGELKLTAHAEDAAGNIEKRPHVRIVGRDNLPAWVDESPRAPLAVVCAERSLLRVRDRKAESAKSEVVGSSTAHCLDAVYGH